MRGRVIGINRGTWCFGAALAGAVATFIMSEWGWRIACVIPAVVALLAVYVRIGLPESPYWVRLQDRRLRIREAQAAGQPLLAADQAWLDRAAKAPIRQLFLPDMLKNTAAATFIACCSTIICGTVGGWMPLYLAQERHWSTATYGTFYIWWGLVGFLGLFFAGLISDRFGRKPAFYIMLIEGAVFLTLWVFAESNTALWIYGLLWSIGFLGFWAPSMILTAEISNPHPRRRQWILVGRGMAGRFCALAIRDHRHPAKHRIICQGFLDRTGGDVVDGSGYLAVYAGAQGQGTGCDRHLNLRTISDAAGMAHCRSRACSDHESSLLRMLASGCSISDWRSTRSNGPKTMSSSLETSCAKTAAIRSCR